MMKRFSLRRTALTMAALAVGSAMTLDVHAYVLSGPLWAAQQVAYVVNTTNLDGLLAQNVVSAVQFGANAWQSQGGVNFGFVYAGPTTQTTNTNDGVNLIVFRNASSGSAIATTYWWSSGTRIIDADIVLWDGAFRFFTGTTGCASGFYIEDIASHEFGHALGLGHSASAAATMYPSTSTCDQRNRSLDADDIAGVRALYPPSTLPQAPSGLRIVS
jgi:hypothetical protein